jgi:hypothetical protein
MSEGSERTNGRGLLFRLYLEWNLSLNLLASCSPVDHSFPCHRILLVRDVTFRRNICHICQILSVSYSCRSSIVSFDRNTKEIAQVCLAPASLSNGGLDKLVDDEFWVSV